ncbi:hypothetical protein MK805_10625 [Shimazuella sp. AN120528]|uniref:hypothetical protein n=1 Tax=Shimazuella soli TaxID=1892854 RepID=UPI001F0E9F23|nr:hypothetical protein [Shimazuella soli]MCH5585405.1 hypothetical protein [Shimazuella soli]
MKEIVCNTSPIIALSKIGHVEILDELFDRVYIPNAVYRETVSDQNGEMYGCKELLRLVENETFQRYEVKNGEVVKKMYGLLACR